MAVRPSAAFEDLANKREIDTSQQRTMTRSELPTRCLPAKVKWLYVRANSGDSASPTSRRVVRAFDDDTVKFGVAVNMQVRDASYGPDGGEMVRCMLFSTRAEAQVVEDRLVAEFEQCVLGAHREYLSCSQTRARLAHLTGKDAREGQVAGSKETAIALFEHALEKAKALFPESVEEWTVADAMTSKYEKRIYPVMPAAALSQRFHSCARACQEQGPIAAKIEEFLNARSGLDVRMDRASGMYDAVALARSGGADLANFRRERARGDRACANPRELLIRMVMRDEQLPRNRVWAVGAGGRSTLVCGFVACSIAQWLRPELEAPIVSLRLSVAGMRLERGLE